MVKKKPSRQKRLKRYPLTLEGLLSALDTLGETDIEEKEIPTEPTLLYFMSRVLYEREFAKSEHKIKGRPRVVA